MRINAIHKTFHALLIEHAENDEDLGVYEVVFRSGRRVIIPGLPTEWEIAPYVNNEGEEWVYWYKGNTVYRVPATEKIETEQIGQLPLEYDTSNAEVVFSLKEGVIMGLAVYGDYLVIDTGQRIVLSAETLEKVNLNVLPFAAKHPTCSVRNNFIVAGNEKETAVYWFMDGDRSVSVFEWEYYGVWSNGVWVAKEYYDLNAKGSPWFNRVELYKGMNNIAGTVMRCKGAVYDADMYQEDILLVVTWGFKLYAQKDYSTIAKVKLPHVATIFDKWLFFINDGKIIKMPIAEVLP